MNDRDRLNRTMTDPQRMIWRDDVEGICPTPDMCFEYSGHARCGPCAIKQATACGVATDYSVPNLPEVYRLRRELAIAQGTSGSAQDAQRLDPQGAGPVPAGDAP